MAVKKKSGDDAGYKKFRADLAAGNLGNVYLFYGEETYLREFYLAEVKKQLVPPGFEAFNFHRLEGKGLTVQALTEAAEAMPMMAERTLVQVTDYDPYKLPEEQRNALVALLNDFPSHCCLVLVFDQAEYKPNRTYKKLHAALEKSAQAVQFAQQDQREILKWIAKRFKAAGHTIDAAAAEHLVFTCGGLMTGLVPEIEKIAAYAKGTAVTRADVDAVADPVLSAEVFKLSDAVLQGHYDQAASILGDLLKMQTEPIMILAALGSQLRRIWTARLALDSGKDRYWLMELWGMKSDYPAKLLLNAARRTTAEWCAQAVRRCQVLDRRMKSERGIDSAGELKLLLVQLAAERS